MVDRLSDLLTWLAGHLHFSELVSPGAVLKLIGDLALDFTRRFADLILLVTGILGFRIGIRRVRAVDSFNIRRNPRHDSIKKIMRIGGGVASLAGITKLVLPSITKQAEDVEMPKRALGGMEFNASILGMGGIYICQGTEAEGIAILESAISLGINYFDTASQYGNGESERRYGIWLERLEAEDRRGQIYVATKTLSRSYTDAKAEIEGSLSRLKTSYVNLLQVHSVNDLDTWRTVNSRNGSLRAIEEAKASGRVKHIGITSHGHPEVLLQILGEYPFESALMALGITDRLKSPFETETLPACVALGISRVAMKVFAEGQLTRTEADLMKCLHYVLSLPISTAIVGMASPAQVIQNVAWTKTFAGMTEDEKIALAEEVAGMIDLNNLWWKN